MTDTEIIKGLECIASEKDVLCKDCSYNKYYLTKCHKMTAKDALDLINRQKELIEKSERIEHFADKTIATLQAEIKRLKAESDTIAEDYSNLVIEKDELFDEAEKLIKKAKAEAAKEFAEKLHEELRMYGIKDKFNKSVFLNVVDKAKKEMAGDNK